MEPQFGGTGQIQNFIKITIFLLDTVLLVFNQYPAKFHKYIFSCGGAVQLGGLVLDSPGLVPLRLRLVGLFYSLKVPLY